METRNKAQQVADIVTPRQAKENFVFEGGGVKGSVLAASYKAVCDAGKAKHLKRVAGSSAGGILAMLIALGYSPKEIMTELATMDFKKFEDKTNRSWAEVLHLGKKAQTAADILTVINSQGHGISEGDVFIKWAEEKIAQKLGNPDATFIDLQNAIKAGHPPGLKALYLTGTNLSKKKLDVFSYDNEEFRDVRIADAVRATMSFPGAFKGVKIKGSFYVDGGLINNCPVEIFDKMGKGSSATLGFKVDSTEEIQRAKGELQNTKTDLGFKEYLGGIVGAILDDTEKMKRYDMIQAHDADVDTLDFNLSDTKKQALIAAGTDAASEYMKKNDIAQLQKSENFLNMPDADLYGYYEKLAIKNIENAVIMGYQLEVHKNSNVNVARHIKIINEVIHKRYPNKKINTMIVLAYQAKQKIITNRDKRLLELRAAKTLKQKDKVLIKLCKNKIQELGSILQHGEKKQFEAKLLADAAVTEQLLWQKMDKDMPEIKAFAKAIKDLQKIRMTADTKGQKVSLVELSKLRTTLEQEFRNIEPNAKGLLLDYFDRNIAKVHSGRNLDSLPVSYDKLQVQVNANVASTMKNFMKCKKEVTHTTSQLKTLNEKVHGYANRAERVEFMHDLHELYGDLNREIYKSTGAFIKINQVMSKNLSSLSWPQKIFGGFKKIVAAAPWCVGHIASALKNKLWKQSDYKFILNAKHLRKDVSSLIDLYHDGHAKKLDHTAIKIMKNIMQSNQRKYTLGKRQDRLSIKKPKITIKEALQSKRLIRPSARE